MRRLGASLGRMEEKMRIRSQQFREQQQRILEEQRREAERLAQEQEPGLTRVLISRISSHGGAGGKRPSPAMEQVAEEEDGATTGVEEEAAEEIRTPGAPSEDAGDEDDNVPTVAKDPPSPSEEANDDAGGQQGDGDAAPETPAEEDEEEEEIPPVRSSYDQVLLMESIDELERRMSSSPGTAAFDASRILDPAGHGGGEVALATTSESVVHDRVFGAMVAKDVGGGGSGDGEHSPRKDGRSCDSELSVPSLGESEKEVHENRAGAEESEEPTTGTSGKPSTGGSQPVAADVSREGAGAGEGAEEEVPRFDDGVKTATVPPDVVLDGGHVAIATGSEGEASGEDSSKSNEGATVVSADESAEEGEQQQHLPGSRSCNDEDDEVDANSPDEAESEEGATRGGGQVECVAEEKKEQETPHPSESKNNISTVSPSDASGGKAGHIAQKSEEDESSQESSQGFNEFMRIV